MAPQIQSPADPPPDTPATPEQPSSFLTSNRYPLLFASYTLLTSLLIFRVNRQNPLLSRTRKWEQYETIFKATTLGAVIIGIGMSGGLNRRRSEVVEMRHRQDELRSGDGGGVEGQGQDLHGREGRERKRFIEKQGLQRD